MRLVAATTLGRHVLNLAARVSTDLVTEVRHGSHRIRLAGGGWRVDTRTFSLATKEPHTLQWINEIPDGATLWDIGANVGIYSIYAALVRRVSVVAFEPSPLNIEILARNVELNGLTDKITIATVALAGLTAPANLIIASPERGGSNNIFGNDFVPRDAANQPSLQIATLGISADDAVAALGLPPPTHIKLDVDGTEGVILEGALRTLREVQSVLVEMPEVSEQSARVSHALLTAGLRRTHVGNLTESERRNEQWDRRG